MSESLAVETVEMKSVSQTSTKKSENVVEDSRESAIFIEISRGSKKVKISL